MGAMRSAIAATTDVAAQGRQATARELLAPQLAAVRGVVFDAPDVLYDATVWRRWLWRLLGQLGVATSYEQFCQRWDAEYLLEVHCGRREFTEAFESFLLSCGLSWGQIDEVEAASRIQMDFSLNVRPLPGAIRAVHGLADRGIPLIAWADLAQNGSQLSDFFDRLGFGACFGAVLTSLDRECAQPAPECYANMADVLRLPASEVLYVGHEAEHLAAAREAGLRTCAVNYTPTAQADVLLASCDDLLRLTQLQFAAPPVARH